MKREKRMYWLIGLVITAALICSPKFTGATSTTNLLITDYGNHRVIEIEPLTHNVIWQYGGVRGTGTNQLYYPIEANKLINGNVLIADRYNHRIIEVQPSLISGGTIVWQYGQTGILGSGANQLNHPEDVKKLANGNVLIADPYNNRVLEVKPTYLAGGNIVWQYSGGSEWFPWETERLADGSTLICTSSQLIRVSGTSSTILWSYTIPEGDGSIFDVEPLVNGNLLISEFDNNRVVELQPRGTSGGTIVWQYGQTGVAGSGVNQLRGPREAIRLANGNTLIVDASHRVIEVKTTDYPNWASSSIVWQQGQTDVSGSGWNQLDWPSDVKEIWQGILNQVIVAYKDMGDISQPVVTAWVFTPVIPPVVIPPVLEVTKTVSPPGTQTKGTVLTYTIGYTNTGEGTATDAVFTDMVPPGTVYQTGSAQIASGPTGAITYSHDSGATYDSSDAGLVTHIRWSIPVIGPGQTGILRFSVRIQ